MKRTIALAFFMIAGTARAEDGAFSLDQSGEIAVDYARTSGRIDRNDLGFSLRGSVLDPGDETDNGSCFGGEFAMRLGVRPAASFDVRIAIAAKLYSFNAPFYGALITLAGTELGFGGMYWWSQNPRASIVGGARLVTATHDLDAHFELGYLVAPFLFTKSALDVKRVEHRFSVAAGSEQLSLGVFFHFVNGTLTTSESIEEADERTLGANVSYRW